MKIEKGIPIPEAKEGYPLDQMEVGDSFTVPLSKRTSVTATISKFKRLNDGIDFTTREVENKQLRVWRIK